MLRFFLPILLPVEKGEKESLAVLSRKEIQRIRMVLPSNATYANQKSIYGATAQRGINPVMDPMPPMQSQLPMFMLHSLLPNNS
jgi:hypothetical protein